MKIKPLSILLALILTGSLCISCNNNIANPKKNKLGTAKTSALSPYNFSLAQWSLHRSFLGPTKDNYWHWMNETLQTNPDAILLGNLHPNDFPKIASELGFNTIELVNTFYYSKVDNRNYWKRFKISCNENKVKVGLIMCDALGELAHSDTQIRKVAIDNHKKWIDVADILGAQSIRVNLSGNGNPEEIAKNSVKSLSQLASYAANFNINVLVENHGGNSSNGLWLAEIMETVHLPNVGTLPDFGNFCITENSNGCELEYDKYKGMKELMPYAKGVSAKSKSFDSIGNEQDIDYKKMMQLVKNAGFQGTIGIEYEGNTLSEIEGIKATLALLQKVISNPLN